MIGIQPGTFHEASKRVGSKRTAIAVFIILQLGTRVRNCAAYFHSITLGKRADSFRPLAILTKLSVSTSVPVWCPPRWTSLPRPSASLILAATFIQCEHNARIKADHVLPIIA